MNDTRAMLVIARRELLERVRSKWFLVGTIVGPIAMIAMLVVPVLIASSSTAGTRVDIVDHTSVLGEPIKKTLEASAQWKVTVVPADTPDATELDKIRRDEINGFITISKDALDGPVGFDQVRARLLEIERRVKTGESLEQALAVYAESDKILYRGDNASSQGVNIILREVVTTIVRSARGTKLEIPPPKLEALMAPVSVRTQHTTGEAKGSSGLGAFFLAYALAFVLYFVITLYGVAVMRSVVTEKTSRVMEMMVAAVKPSALMNGKILGVCGAGLIQIAVWLTMGALLITYNEVVLGWFGAKGGSPAALPSFAGFEVIVVLAFFVLGFFFYAAMYAAVGAMVSSEQDTQQVQMPVTMMLVIGVVCLQVISNAPRGGAATVMSNVPLWSPMLMPMRYVLGGATLGEVAISLGILVLSTLLVMRAAAKIYRVGVLMYGKRPSLRELVRWLRY